MVHRQSQALAPLSSWACHFCLGYILRCFTFYNNSGTICSYRIKMCKHLYDQHVVSCSDIEWKTREKLYWDCTLMVKKLCSHCAVSQELPAPFHCCLICNPKFNWWYQYYICFITGLNNCWNIKRTAGNNQYIPHLEDVDISPWDGHRMTCHSILWQKWQNKDLNDKL